MVDMNYAKDKLQIQIKTVHKVHNQKRKKRKENK